MKNILSLIFTYQLLAAGVTAEINDTDNTEENETKTTSDKVENKSTILANDIVDALIVSMGIDVHVIPNKRLLQLREKLNKINFYSFDQAKYMELLREETNQNDLNQTKFYEALNTTDDMNYLQESNPTNVYLKLKQKMNRDDILDILKRNNVSLDNNESNNIEDANLDKLIVDPHEDKSNLSGTHYSSSYWDPKPELERRQDMVSGRRLFKGKRAYVNHFPFMVSVHIMGRFFCGGALYWHDLVLTSASCLQLLHNNRFFRENPRVLHVRVGSNHSRIGGEMVGALEVYFHPGYNPRKLLNNIAAVRLERHIRFTHRRVPKIIDISEKKESVPTDIPVLLLGWGVTRTSKKMSYEPVFLQQKMVPIYPNIMCKEIYGKEKFVMKTMFCAGSMTEGDGACDHDAGGPAIFNGRLVGIISYGTMGCGVPNAPTVFTHIGVFSDWIKEINNTHPRYYVGYARTTTTEAYQYTIKTTEPDDSTPPPKVLGLLSPIWSTPMPEMYDPYVPVNQAVEIEKIPSPADFGPPDDLEPPSFSVHRPPEPSAPPGEEPVRSMGRQRKPKKPQEPVPDSMEPRTLDEAKEYKFHFGSKT